MFETYEGKKYVIGVSGGPDSMALLSMCLEHHVNVIVAHVNYHQREQAVEEEAYVRTYCAAHDVLCLVKNEPFTYTGNFEAQARTYRYAFFEEIVHTYHCDGIFTAHHQDDLLETYLMQKEKGIVPMTYGISPVSLYHGISLERPLLSYTKEALIRYCDDHQLTYYIDETNLQDIHTRNVIRNHTLKEMDDAEKKALLKEINARNEALRTLRTEAQVLIQDEKVSLCTYRMNRKEVRLCTLRLILAKRGLTEKFLEEIDKVLMKQNDFIITVQNSCLAQRDGNFFVTQMPQAYEVVLHDLQRIRQTFFCTAEEGSSLEGVYVQEGDFPLTVRNARQKDAIVMRFGTKKLNRFFVDRHIARIDRAAWPVLCNCKGEIILVPGLGCDIHHYHLPYNFYLKTLKS